MPITVFPCICHSPRLCQCSHQLEVLAIALCFLFWPFFWFLEQLFNRYFSLIFLTFNCLSTEITFVLVVLEQRFRALNKTSWNTYLSVLQRKSINFLVHFVIPNTKYLYLANLAGTCAIQPSWILKLYKCFHFLLTQLFFIQKQ